MRVAASRVRQPLGEFFLTVLPADFFVNRVRNRPRSSDDPQSDDVQRVFNRSRVENISAFTEDPQASFPTPIILAVDSAIITEVSPPIQLQGVDTPIVLFDIPNDGDIGDVLDGQHRILGLRGSTRRAEFDLGIVLMFDLNIDDKAFVFSTINSKQTPVSSSLIYDLFGLSSARSPQKTCNYIAQALNTREGGPFHRRLKMLGMRESHHDGGKVMLSQGTFASRLQELISRRPDEDARLLKAEDAKSLREDIRCPLRKYFLRGDDASILKIVTNYFTAIADVFSTEWEDKSGEFILRKSVGYTSLIIVFRHLMEEGFKKQDLSLPFFKSRAEQMKQNLGARTLTSDVFPSSGAGAISLAKALLGVEKLTYGVVEAPDIEDVRLDS